MEFGFGQAETGLGLGGLTARLQSARERTFRQYESEFRALLGRRLGLSPDHGTPELMAAIISASFRVAMCRWTADDNSTMIGELRATLTHLPDLFGQMSARPSA